MPENKKVSVVIAACNEEPRIASILSVLKDHPLIDEVIIVNDGSTDKTSDVIKRFNVTLIENKINMGKTFSIKCGLEKSKNEVILFLDADLVGLTKQNINDLVNPVLNGQVEWTLSLRGNSSGYMKLFKVDWISGERAVRKYLLNDPLIWSKTEIGFSLEILMNKSFIDRGKTFQSIYLPNLKVVNKSGKIGFFKGLYGELKMVGQIFKVLPPHKIIHQFFKMSYLNKKIKKSITNVRANEV
jgi:glycosyltransferase involved in cell wall biosynthesis